MGATRPAGRVALTHGYDPPCSDPLFRPPTTALGCDGMGIVVAVGTRKGLWLAYGERCLFTVVALTRRRRGVVVPARQAYSHSASVGRR